MSAGTEDTAVLVGDIGGTNTRLALYRSSGGSKPLIDAAYSSRKFDDLAAVVDGFLSRTNVHPCTAVFGVAGPVVDGSAKVTNLKWRLEERGLSKRLRIPHVRLLNDLAAISLGCLHGPPRLQSPLTQRLPVGKGKNLAVIAAGTGLGEARLLWNGTGHLACASEGGHRDFAPRNAIELEFIRFLMERFPGHVSYERVLSGAGLACLYDFFLERSRRHEPSRVTDLLAEGDRNAQIAALGLTGQFKPASEAVDCFVTIYGAEAGNLALGELALGGVYVAGNIATKLVLSRRKLFMAGFRAKGRFSPMLRNIPVVVVNDPSVGLRGALAHARALRPQLSR